MYVDSLLRYRCGVPSIDQDCFLWGWGFLLFLGWLALLFLAGEVGVCSTSFWVAFEVDKVVAVLAKSFSFPPVGACFLWV